MFDTVRIHIATKEPEIFERVNNISHFECKHSRRGGFNLTGSLNKFIKGNNFEPIMIEDVGEAIGNLSELLSKDINDAHVYRLDTSVNCEMQAPVNEYLRDLSICRYYKRWNIEDFSTVKYINQLKTKLFYDKIKEYIENHYIIPDKFQDKNILRFELRYMRRLKAQLHLIEPLTAKKLYEYRFYNQCLDNLQKEFEMIETNKTLLPVIGKPSRDSFNKLLKGIGLQTVGVENALLLLENNKPKMTKDSYYRLRADIRNTAKCKFMIETDRMRELREKIKNSIEFLRP